MIFIYNKGQDQESQKWYPHDMTGSSTIRTNQESFRCRSDYRCRLCYLFSQVSSSSAAWGKLCESEAPFLPWIFLHLWSRSDRENNIFWDSPDDGLVSSKGCHSWPSWSWSFFQSISLIMVPQNLPIENFASEAFYIDFKNLDFKLAFVHAFISGCNAEPKLPRQPQKSF